MSEKETLAIVIVGHVDHGKSTLIGRLLYDTNSIPEAKINELKKVSEDLGRKLEFAHLMDHLEEERLKGITIETTQTFFHTDKRRYVIIDAPGHKEFLKNMITGSSQAEASLLLVDANEGIMEQTKRHCYLLSMIGLRQICVLINKMDLVNYSQDIFIKLKESIINLLKEVNLTPKYVIPISASEGDNIASISKNINWYSDETVLNILDKFDKLKIEQKSLRFPVQDIYNLNGNKISVGKIESGVVNKNQKAVVLPENINITIADIVRYQERNIEKAYAGSAIGIRINEDINLKRGQVIVNYNTAEILNSIKTNIFWMDNVAGKKDEVLIFKCVTEETKCKIKEIHNKFDPALSKVIEKDAQDIKEAEVAEVELEFEDKIVMDKFVEIPEMGRFILERNGVPVAGGLYL